MEDLKALRARAKAWAHAAVYGDTQDLYMLMASFAEHLLKERDAEHDNRVSALVEEAVAVRLDMYVSARVEQLAKLAEKDEEIARLKAACESGANAYERGEAEYLAKDEECRALHAKLATAEKVAEALVGLVRQYERANKGLGRDRSWESLWTAAQAALRAYDETGK